MRRIAIVGCCGSGKSVLATKMGAKLGLPVVRLDHLNWKPGWISSDPEEFARAQQNAFNSDGSWIADRNYGATVELRFAAAARSSFSTSRREPVFGGSSDDL